LVFSYRLVIRARAWSDLDLVLKQHL
jgi:hypothetical protein